MSTVLYFGIRSGRQVIGPHREAVPSSHPCAPCPGASLPGDHRRGRRSTQRRATCRSSQPRGHPGRCRRSPSGPGNRDTTPPTRASSPSGGPWLTLCSAWQAISPAPSTSPRSNLSLPALSQSTSASTTRTCSGGSGERRWNAPDGHPRPLGSGSQSAAWIPAPAPVSSR